MIEGPATSVEAGGDRKQLAVRTVWDTSYVREKDKFSFFRDGICQAFLALTPEKPDQGNIAARVEKAQFDFGWFGRIDVSPHCVQRTASDRAQISDDYVHLGMKMQGESEIKMAESVLAYRPGDVALINPKHLSGFNLSNKTRFRSVNIIFKRGLIKEAELLSESNHMIIRNDNRFDPLKICMSVIDERYNKSSDAELKCLIDAAISLLEARIIKDREFFEDKFSSSAGARNGLLFIIKQFIRHSVADHRLSGQHVATNFGISVRYIQSMFAEEGHTFKSYLTDLRLDHIKADLLDPSNVNIPAIDIAFRWGYVDKTTFHRNFKARFGATPGQMR